MPGKIKYRLMPYSLNEGTGFRGHVMPTRTATLDDVVDRMVSQGSTLTRVDILGAIEGFNSAVEGLVQEGACVHTSLVIFGVSFQGTFEHLEDPFDPTQHRLVPKVKPGARLRRMVARHCHPERRPSTGLGPIPTHYFDVATGEWDETVTPGGLGRVMGHRLRFAPDDPAYGLFFIDADANETRVTMFSHNEPRGLTFLVPPDLAPGSYRIRMRTIYGQHEMWDGGRAKLLTVAPAP